MNITLRGINLPVDENSEFLLRHPQKLPRDSVWGLMEYGRILESNAPQDEVPLLKVGVLALPHEVTITGLVDKPSKIFGVIYTRQPDRIRPECVRTQTRSDVWARPPQDAQIAVEFLKRISTLMSEAKQADEQKYGPRLAILKEYPNELLLAQPGFVLSTCVKLLQVQAGVAFANQ